MKATELQKQYAKMWYLHNKEKHRKSQLKHRQQLRDIVKKAKSKPCADCSIQYPYYVMQFDHLPEYNKIAPVGRVQSLGEIRIRLEIAKCDVVCANCHMERTHARLINVNSTPQETIGGERV